MLNLLEAAKRDLGSVKILDGTNFQLKGPNFASRY